MDAGSCIWEEFAVIPVILSFSCENDASKRPKKNDLSSPSDTEEL